MKCGRCGVNEANIIIKQSLNGKDSEAYLCETCAKAMGIGSQTFSGFGINPAVIWPGSLLSAFDKIGKAAAVNTGVFVPGMPSVSVCKGCGMTLTEFREKGKLGCSKCYDAFSQQLDQVFRRIQSGEIHRGRKIAEEPENIEIRAAQDEIAELKQKIGKAVETEDYELAAKIKTEIEKLNNRIDSIRSSEGSADSESKAAEKGGTL